MMEKRINVRVEHVRPSKCQDDFYQRVKENDAKRKAAKEQNIKLEVMNTFCLIVISVCLLLFYRRVR